MYDTIDQNFFTATLPRLKLMSMRIDQNIVWFYVVLTQSNTAMNIGYGPTDMISI